jgi:hypothetical protein
MVRIKKRESHAKPPSRQKEKTQTDRITQPMQTKREENNLTQSRKAAKKTRRQRRNASNEPV